MINGKTMSIMTVSESVTDIDIKYHLDGNPSFYVSDNLYILKHREDSKSFTNCFLLGTNKFITNFFGEFKN